jgi:hypothetical protein
MAAISFIERAPREGRPVVDQPLLSPQSGCSGEFAPHFDRVTLVDGQPAKAVQRRS